MHLYLYRCVIRVITARTQKDCNIKIHRTHHLNAIRVKKDRDHNDYNKRIGINIQNNFVRYGDFMC
jgi:hypothetical protein